MTAPVNEAGMDKVIAALTATGYGCWWLDLPSQLLVLDQQCMQLSGAPAGGLDIEALLGYVHPLDKEAVNKAFLNCIKEKENRLQISFRTVVSSGTDPVWIHCRGAASRNEDGELVSFTGLMHTLAAPVYNQPDPATLNALSQLEASEARFRSIVEQSPMAIGLLRGRDMIVELGNEMMFDIWGKGKNILGMKIIDVLPEIRDQGFMELMERVFDTGEPYLGYGYLAKLHRNGRLEEGYFDFAYTPVRDLTQNIMGIMVMATDVTKQVLAKQAIEKSEYKFRSLLEEAPFATALYQGRELVIEMANDAMIRLWGKDPSVIGMHLQDALPELEGQPFIDLLHEVFDTGIAYHAKDQRADLVVDGKLSSFYFNFTYKPLFDENGKTYSILNMAMDVTDQYLNRKKVEEAESALRGAVELAELGTWGYDMQTQEFFISDRLKSWLGIEEDRTGMETFNSIVPEDRDRIANAVQAALTPGSSGLYDEEYRIMDLKSGQQRILHAQGRTIFDGSGKPISINGTVQDVTTQREIQLSLENEVQQRTEELAAANDKLKSINEELAETNRQLSRSNEELAQYAYVASHDLQEPLRKIMLFSDMLRKKTGKPEEQSIIIEKINRSADRMSNLIQSLLEFSRLLQSDTLIQPVNLQSILNKVMTDFELSIQEKNATINIGPMPVIDAIELQMNQLFYNLFSNALKFTTEERQPEISISASIFGNENGYHFHHIRFSDNGIGIEDRYKEQIFEVFRKLHTRDIYQGSGIGLSICRRIVANHEGTIHVESEPGKGTTFHIMLPARLTQPNSTGSHQ